MNLPEKLESKSSEYWTFEDCIDNRIAINSLIICLEEQDGEIKRLREAVRVLADYCGKETSVEPKKTIDEILNTKEGEV